MNRRYYIWFFTLVVILALAAASLSSVQSENSDSAEGEVHELTFKPIDLAPENLRRFTFLEELHSEIEKQRVAYVDRIRGDLRFEGVPFEPPKVRLTQIDFDGLPVVISTFSGGTLSSLNCGNAGCGYAFYQPTRDGYRLVGSITATQLFKASCPAGDFLIVPGGPGAGITRPMATVWRVSSNELMRVGTVNALPSEYQCSTIVYSEESGNAE